MIKKVLCQRSPIPKYFIIFFLAFQFVASSDLCADELDSGKEALVNKDYAEAISRFLPLAKNGDPTAQMHLGAIYLEGLGVQKDNGTAFFWFQKAATQGEMTAAFEIGKLYFEGNGIDRSWKNGLYWFSEASAPEYSIPKIGYVIQFLIINPLVLSLFVISAILWSWYSVARKKKASKTNHDSGNKTPTSIDSESVPSEIGSQAQDNVILEQAANHGDQLNTKEQLVEATFSTAILDEKFNLFSATRTKEKSDAQTSIINDESQKAPIKKLVARKKKASKTNRDSGNKTPTSIDSESVPSEIGSQTQDNVLLEQAANHGDQLNTKEQLVEATFSTAILDEKFNLDSATRATEKPDAQTTIIKDESQNAPIKKEAKDNRIPTQPATYSNTLGSSKFFNGLNKNQCEAVSSTEGYVRIIAGAGSGKTKVLVNRYAYIVEELGINPGNILCVTFTNRAAKEMKSRIQRILVKEPVNDFICTFHGFCVRILRQDIHKINYPKSFSILDVEDQKSILHEIYENLGISSTEATYKHILKEIATYKNSNPYVEEYIVPNDPISYKNEFSIEKKILMEYLRIQKKNYALDFEDLILFALFILQKHGEVLEKWQSRLHYIMVDETQDNSTRQWLFAELLSGINKNLFVVGDPDQSIYEWRGAKPEVLVGFDKTHVPCRTIILNQNYRSTEKILKIANSIIVNNTVRVTKDMLTDSKVASRVVHFHAVSEEEESNWVSNLIKQRRDATAGGVEVAILFRASFLSRPFEQALIRQEIPYVIYGGIRFFERKEIKNALSYLKLVGTGDDMSFLRVINTPSRKIGKVFIKNLCELAEQRKESLYETLKSSLTNMELKKRSAIDFIEMIERAKTMVGTYRISDILQFLLEQSKLIESIRLDGDEDRLQNIEELMQSVKNYENSNSNEETVNLDEYLQDIALYTNVDYKEDSKVVKLMTIHQSKGMEFEVVFVVGMSEGIFPSHRSIRDRKLAALEEERRLAYVAITRAEKELFLTESEGFNYATGNKYPSRFLYEIKSGLVDLEGTISQEIVNGSKDLIRRSDIELLKNGDVFELGELVIHPVFGEGTIKAVHRGDNSHYDVYFYATEKTKPISLDYAELKRVECV